MFVAQCHQCETTRRNRKPNEKSRLSAREWDKWQKELRMKDPQLMAEWRAKKRDQKRKQLATEEGRQRAREACRRWRARKDKEDPDWRQRNNEDIRMYRRLRRERDGIALPLPPIDNRAPVRAGKSGLPIGPFREWMEEQIVMQELRDPDQPAEMVVREGLGLSEKRLWRIRYDIATIDQETVDHCLRDAPIRFEDLYPEI